MTHRTGRTHSLASLFAVLIAGAWGAIIVLLGALSCTAAFADTTVVSISGTDTGRTFDGIGALSAGASSRLLVDYPAKQRNEILDYLFKPNFGAALQINKVEIGGDCNSTDGSEPSHMHSPTDQNYHRGYEWSLMVESKKRNPNEKLYALEWGAPGWINPEHNDVWTSDNVTYILNWLKHAKSDYGLTIDAIGGWNERGYSKPWYESFRQALDSNGFNAIKLVGDDSFRWDVAKDMSTDHAFASSVDIIGQHYPDVSPNVMHDDKWKAALASGKTIWLSEMGSAGYNAGAAKLARTFNDAYIDARATADINWSTIWSVYKGLPYATCGLMLADEPWSGHYVVGKSIWAVAHTTQFAQPGWQYLDGACGFFGGAVGNGSFVTLKSPNNVDYSVIAETTDAKMPQSASFHVSGGLSMGSLHVWRTDLSSNDSKDWFVRQSDLTRVNGNFTVTLDPHCVYSITTTTGQQKGKTTPPPSRQIRLPYRENFASYATGSTPRLFSDQMGTFEVAPVPNGSKGKCLRQVVSQQPVLWSAIGDPSTVMGDPSWSDYQVTSDVFLEQPGYVDLVGRMQSISGGNSQNINGYHLRITDAGNWSLIRKVGEKDIVLASGTAPFSTNAWHNVTLRFSDNLITGLIDKNVVVKDFADDGYSHGLVGYEVGKWQNADFRNLVVTAVPSHARPKLHVASAVASSSNDGYGPENAIDGDSSTMWHTEFDTAPAALPQSVTLNAGTAQTVAGLTYLPRQDGQQNGTITSYQIETSVDGTRFTQAAAGQWADDDTLKVARFAPVLARYVRLTALAGHGGYASAAEIDLLGRPAP
jgi:hypothetical protein